jgi:hypothetical protein
MLSIEGEDTFTYVLEYDYYPGKPAVLGGPPENCSEAEPAELDLEPVGYASFEDLILAGF